MEPIIIFIAFFFVFIPLVLLMIFVPVLKDKKARNNVRNSDTFTQHYCFELNCNQQEAIRQLSIRNSYDVLEYTFDSNSLIISFSYFGVAGGSDHQLSFYTVENKTYLKVSRVKYLSAGVMMYRVNSFFINKIGAVPVDYYYFESVVSSVHK